MSSKQIGIAYQFETTRKSVVWASVFTTLLAASWLSSTPASAQGGVDSEFWIQEGDEDRRWTNSDNWLAGQIPDSTQGAHFTRLTGPEVQYVDFNATVSVVEFEVSDALFLLGAIDNIDLTLNGRPGTSLTTQTMILSATETVVDTGLVDVTLIEMMVTADLELRQDTGGRFSLALDETVFTANTDYDFSPVDLTLRIREDSVFAGSGLFTPSAGTDVVVRDGGALDWATLYDDSAGQSMTVITGGGFIYNNFSGLGDITTIGGTSAVLSFGDPDSTDAHSGAVSGVISGSGGVSVESENYELTLLGSNTFTGGLRVNAGTVNISSGPNMGGLSGFLQFGGGTLSIHSNVTIAIDVFASSGFLDTNDNHVTITGDVIGLGGIDATLTKTGIGTLTLNNDGSGFVGTYIVDEGTLVSGAGDTFSDRCIVQVNSGATLRFDGNENFGGVSGDGTINVNGMAMRIGFFDTTGQNFAGQLVGSGTVVKEGAGIQSFSGDNSGFTGTFDLNQGGLRFATGDSAAQQSFNILSGTSIGFNPDAGVSSVYHGVISGSGGFGLSGAGTITLTGDSSAFTGLVDLFGGGRMNVNGSLGGSFVFLSAAATLGGSGTITTDVFTSANTVIAPGTSAGILTADSFTFVDDSTLEIELGGETAGTGYDRLVAVNGLTLEGTLDVALIDSYDPTAGTVFDILDWGTLTGTFDEVLLPTLGTGLLWDEAALYTAGELKVVSNGDLNGDGLVGVEDLDILLANWGDAVTAGSLALGDADGSGVVGQADLDIVLSHWGNVSPIAGDVPEPGTAVLVGLGLLTWARRRRVA